MKSNLRSLAPSLAVLLLAGLPAMVHGGQPPAVAQAIEEGYRSSDPQVLAHCVAVIEEELGTHPADMELRKALAILLLDRLHEPARAVPYLQAVVSQSPDEGTWQQALARAFRASGDMEQAARHFAKAAELQPGDAWVRYELGNTLSGAGKYPEASEAYRSSLAIDPRNTDTRLALAKTLWAEGKTAEATETARAVLEYDPLNSAARKLLLASETPPAPPPPPPVPAPPVVAPPAPPSTKPLSPVDAAVAAAYLSGKETDFQKAATDLEAWLKRSPRDLPRRKTLAYLYLEKLHAPGSSIPHFQKVTELAPNDAAWWSMLAKAQETAGDYAGSVESYRQTAAHAPKDVWARYHMACSLRRIGRPVEAEAAFRDALRVEPGNRYVRRELARCAYDAGEKKEAAEIARSLVAEDPSDADAHAVLGDVARSQLNFAAAGTEYQAALAAQPAHAIALSGMNEIRREQRSEVKLSYYTFDDTDDFRQSGIFSYVSCFVTGRIKASVAVNERFFKRDPYPMIDRLETLVGLDFRVSSMLQISAGGGQFKTEDHSAIYGGNVALYFAPISYADAWVSYRSAEPVNDSYITASTAFSQSVVAAGLNLHPIKSIVLSGTASEAKYSDDNIRRSALASAAWYVPLPGSPVVRLEYEWLDYERHTSAYSSPDNYARFRPVLELSPRLTDWLKIELHGELSYVFDEEQWGTGYTAGIRVNKGDSFDLGFTYMEYEIPGGQTTWSGSGFKVDLTGRF